MLEGPMSGDYNRPTETRPVWAFDGAGGSKFYYSIGDCARDLQVPASSIAKCCQGTYKSSHGYTFKYYDEDYEIDQLGDFRKHNIEKHKRRKKEGDSEEKLIVAVDIRTARYRLYNSFSLLCDELMLDPRNAYRCLKHSRYHKSVGGYSLWRYNEVNFEDLVGKF